MSIPKLYGVLYIGGAHKLRETSPSVKHQDVSRRAMFHAVYVRRGVFHAGDVLSVSRGLCQDGVRVMILDSAADEV